VRCGDITCPVGSTCGPNNECVPQLCGNDTLDGTEECDGDSTITDANLRCTDFGYYGVQPVACSATCTIDTSVCNGTCGDHEVNGPELCDGIPPEGYACADFGFDAGGLGCSDACSVALDQCAAIGWRDAAGGATNELRAVWLDDGGNGVAVGLGGTILRADQGVWSPMPSPTTNNLYGVSGYRDDRDPNNVHTVIIAVGAQGTILRYEDGAITTVSSPVNVDLNAVSAFATDRGFIVGDGGTILAPAGDGWTVVTSPTTNALFGVAANDVGAIAVGASGTIIRELSGAWSAAPGAPSTSNTLRAVTGAGTDLFVGGDNRTLFHFVASGSSGTWSTIDLAPLLGAVNADVLSLYAARRTATAIDAFAGLSGGLIVRWDGTQPLLQTSPTSRSLYGMYGTSASRVVAVTRGGRVIQYSGTDRHVVENGMVPDIDGTLFRVGTTLYATTGGHVGRAVDGVWEAPIEIAPDIRIKGLWGDGQDIYAAVDAPGNANAANLVGVWKSPASGTLSFTRVASVGGKNGIYGAASTIYAVGANIQKFDGVSWTVDRPKTGDEILDSVFATPEGDWFVVGGEAFTGTSERAVVLVKHAGDTTWTKLPVDLPRRLLRVWGTSSTDLFAVGAIGMVAHYDGTTWRQMYTGTAENFSALHGTSHADVYAGGPNSTLYHYDGLAWTRTNTLAENVYGIWAAPAELTIVGQTSPSGLAETTSRALVEHEDRCQDPFDNDGDGLLNCDDDDCRDSLACLRGGACETLERVTCTTAGAEFTTFTGHASIDDFSCLDHSTPGPEESLRFVAETTGPVTITVADPSNLLDLVVLDAKNAGCDVTTCRAPTRGADGTQSITFDAITDQLYFIVVDGPVSTALPFTVTVACP
jgi:hypothetical protein